MNELRECPVLLCGGDVNAVDFGDEKFKILLDALKVGDWVICKVPYRASKGKVTFPSTNGKNIIVNGWRYSKDDITDIRDIYGVWQHRWKVEK